MKGKRVVLSGKFHVTTKVLLEAVKAAEADTATRVKKKAIKKGKRVVEEGSGDEEVNYDLLDEDGSDYGDCIIVER